MRQQTNGEIKRQNQHFLKAMKHCQAWREELDWSCVHIPHDRLFRPTINYHSQSTTDTVGRQVLCKTPTLQELHVLEPQVEDKDREMKQEVKDYADTRQNALTTTVIVGDSALLQQQKQNKMTPAREADLYCVVDRCGNQVTDESPMGVR